MAARRGIDSPVASYPSTPEVKLMPVIYIKKDHYDELIKRDEVPKDVIDKLLSKYLN